MFNRKINFAALLISLLALCREVVASCSEGQYLSNGTCVNCTACGTYRVEEHCTNTTDTVCSTTLLVPSCDEGQYLNNGTCVACASCGQNRVDKQCTNTSNTICSKCRKWQIPNAGGGCDFDCNQCSPHGRCIDGKHCECFNGYSGTICDVPSTSTPSTDPPERTIDNPEEDNNRVVFIICIVVASVLALVVVIGLVVVYVTCSKRSTSDSENSDESTFSSASINSRTMLTNDYHHSNGSLQQQSSQTSKSNGYGYRNTILPPPEPWNNNLVSAIK